MDAMGSSSRGGRGRGGGDKGGGTNRYSGSVNTRLVHAGSEGATGGRAREAL